tara:strand:+ start:1012 stop:1212 length:201 start_codon:yes stop_codon:yes gene_type:complete
MVDQTQDEITALHSENKDRMYKIQTLKLFDEWLKQCPVVYYLSEKTDEEKADKIIKYTFDKKVRRK